MATVTVIYPKGTKFDMDYYKKTHMPLVGEHWGQYGLKSWKVLEFGPDAEYCVQATLEFGSMEEVGKANSSSEAKTVMGDVPNFSDKQPLIMAGPIVCTS